MENQEEYQEKIYDSSSGSAAERADDRRRMETPILMGEYPTDQELETSIAHFATDQELAFFSDRGLRFAAAWFLYNFAESLDGDASKVPDADIIDRIKGVLGKMNRDTDKELVKKVILEAREWYAKRQKK